MTDLEHRVSLVWVVDSYWRTISTTHMGLSAGLVRGDRQSHGVLMAASVALGTQETTGRFGYRILYLLKVRKPVVPEPMMSSAHGGRPGGRAERARPNCKKVRSPGSERGQTYVTTRFQLALARP